MASSGLSSAEAPSECKASWSVIRWSLVRRVTADVVGYAVVCEAATQTELTMAHGQRDTCETTIHTSWSLPLAC
eukprot:11734280-Prorocentrum_lima.AAC.1